MGNKINHDDSIKSFSNESRNANSNEVNNVNDMFFTIKDMIEFAVFFKYKKTDIGNSFNDWLQAKKN